MLIIWTGLEDLYMTPIPSCPGIFVSTYKLGEVCQPFSFDIAICKSNDVPVPWDTKHSVCIESKGHYLPGHAGIFVAHNLADPSLRNYQWQMLDRVLTLSREYHDS